MFIRVMGTNKLTEHGMQILSLSLWTCYYLYFTYKLRLNDIQIRKFLPLTTARMRQMMTLISKPTTITTGARTPLPLTIILLLQSLQRSRLWWNGTWTEYNCEKSRATKQRQRLSDTNSSRMICKLISCKQQAVGQTQILYNDANYNTTFSVFAVLSVL